MNWQGNVKTIELYFKRNPSRIFFHEIFYSFRHPRESSHAKKEAWSHIAFTSIFHFKNRIWKWTSNYQRRNIQACQGDNRSVIINKNFFGSYVRSVRTSTRMSNKHSPQQCTRYTLFTWTCKQPLNEPCSRMLPGKEAEAPEPGSVYSWRWMFVCVHVRELVRI